MNKYKCPRCKRYGLPETHVCPPAYGVRLDDPSLEDEEEIYADSPEDAAKTFLSDHFDDFDYPSKETVIVNDWKANNWAGHLYTYEVTVEMNPVFHTELVSEKDVTDE